MPTANSIPLPAAHALRKLGRDLALARRKRDISTGDMAARLFVSRNNSIILRGTWCFGGFDFGQP